MKHSLSFLLGALICFIPCMAMANNIVALFAPNLDFKDGAERNAYVNKIAKELSTQTGLQWEGMAFARASDFESARSNLFVAILDADYYASKGGSLKPVGMLSANGQTTRPLKVIAKRGNSDKLYQYKGKRLALVANTSLATTFITASLLGNEIKASDYFSAIEEVRDVRLAINAVEMGNADLSMVFDGYDSGFTTVYTSSPVALPIIAINSTKLSGEQAETVKTALQNMSIKTSSFITGTAAYNAADAAAYKRIANTRKTSTLTYQPVEPEITKLNITPGKLVDRENGITFNPFQVQFIPTFEEFDKKLEQKL